MVERYEIQCSCGNRMRVKKRHFGRMCRCTECRQPLYVTYDAVHPPVKPFAKGAPRHFTENDVPVHWQKGDLFMELYEVKGLLGKGGMGRVYKVRHRGWDLDLAVKSPKPELLSYAGVMDNVQREAEFWVNLGPHPNIVSCFYVRKLGGVPRVFMEFVEGGALSAWIKQGWLYQGGRKRALERMLDIAIQFAWGLHHAHEHGLIHQDVKPANVLVAADGLAKVTDFGLARAWTGVSFEKTDAANATIHGSPVGTPMYCSPEGVSSGEVTRKADLWSWGASISEMFMGGLRWATTAAAPEILDRYLKVGLDNPFIPPMPEPLGELVRDCLKENPEDRPEGMLEVADALRDVYAGATGASYHRGEPQSAAVTADMLNNRAVSLLDLGKREEAERLWAEALDREPQHLEATYNQGLNLWRTGRLTDAELLKELEQLCLARPDSWFPPYLAGRVVLERGDYQNAVRVLEVISEEGAKSRDVIFAQALARSHVKRSRRLMWSGFGHVCPITAVFLTWDGWLALSGGVDGTLKLWEIITGECQMEFRGHTKAVYSACLSLDEKLAVSGSGDGTIKVWDTSSGRCVRTLQGHTRAVTSVCLSEDARVAISASRDHTLRLWDVASGKCLTSLAGHGARVNSVALSKCGRTAVSGSSDTTVKMWDLEAAKCSGTLKGHTASVRSVCLSADRRLALSGSDDALIKLWDLAKGACVRTFTGHKTPVHAVHLSEGARYMLSGSRRGTLKLWNVATGQCLQSFAGHAPACLSKDGRYALSGTEDGTLKLWVMACDLACFAAPFLLCRKAQ